ncbi:8-amino-7-oxononanoate synthase, partial [bacterium]|nr:8-amino-7-oxononanoate synthase [bacterium]
LQKEIESIKDSSLYRSLKEIQPAGNGTALWEKKVIYNFAANNYLGLAAHPNLICAAKEALDKYGVGAGASRLISGTSSYHTELEEKTASFLNRESALVFPTGYMANLGTITALVDSERDLVVADRLCHASLIDACRASGAVFKVFPHNDWQKLDALLERSIPYRRILVVTDGVFSMDGDLSALCEIGKVAQKHNAWLLVDDAHGLGVLGSHGRGACEFLDAEELVTVFTGNFSKAVGVAGGFASGPSELKELLINKARSFIFTTGIPPVLCAAACAGLEIVINEPWRRERLMQNSCTVRSALRSFGFRVPDGITPIIPVMIGNERTVMELSHFLLEQGILVPGIRYPTVKKGQARLRLSVQATHSDDDIRHLISIFASAAKKYVSAM